MSISGQLCELLEAISWKKGQKTIAIHTAGGGEYRAVPEVEDLKALTAAFDVMHLLGGVQDALNDFSYWIDNYLKDDALWKKLTTFEKKVKSLEYQTRKWRASVNWWAQRGDPYRDKIRKNFLETNKLIDKLLKMGLPLFQSIKAPGGEAEDDIGTSYNDLVTKARFFQAAIKKAVSKL
jgi:hypothetical protein